MFYPVHSFDVSLEKAKRIQGELRKRVEISDAISNINEIELIGGADVAFIETVPNPSRTHNTDKKFCNNNISYDKISHKRNVQEKRLTALAGIVIIDSKYSCVVERVCATVPVNFPYIPGFLSFREGPAILAAFGKLSEFPGVIIYDGCGIAHPRGLGLASHMAVLTGIPSIGCAKSRLYGECEEPGQKKGDWTALTHKGKPIGACLRTRDNIKPVYVSPGSGFSVSSARELVLSLVWKYRLPEPTRLAHNLVTAKKKTYFSNV